MNAVFNQLDFVHRLEAEGLARGAAEVIAAGIDEGRNDLATKADIAQLRTELRAEIAAVAEPLATKAELKLEVSEALRKQTNQLGAMLVGGLAVMTAILGLLVSIK